MKKSNNALPSALRFQLNPMVGTLSTLVSRTYRSILCARASTQHGTIHPGVWTLRQVQTCTPSPTWIWNQPKEHHLELQFPEKKRESRCTVEFICRPGLNHPKPNVQDDTTGSVEILPTIFGSKQRRKNSLRFSFLNTNPYLRTPKSPVRTSFHIFSSI